MTPWRRNTILFRSFQQLNSFRYLTLEGLFELEPRPPRALSLAANVAKVL